MPSSDVLVSVCLPVRNGASSIERVVRSVLAQDHRNLELVISDNASVDGTEDLCRKLARDDDRIVYIRQAENIGLLNNFQAAMQRSRGKFFRWVGDDDWLAPNCLSRCLEAFESDARLILVTMGVEFIGTDGISRTAEYTSRTLASDDPIERLGEILRLLNESYLLIDPLYALMRRAAVESIPRRNMFREDQVFAVKLALAGPWGHVGEILGRRGWRAENRTQQARRLGVPVWTARVANTFQGLETLRWINNANLDVDQRRRARAALHQWYIRRQLLTMAGRGRRLARLIRFAPGP
ncbi:MAG TPA: glycosyltransferase family 2 protein [Hyphomicrobiaceae bacterium]|jgi:glycosyltransferase involved in cell wall biosynthesis|nr:glycosyltransferase family 2 protein [Hyphomicrobiaceae bacterium]